MTQSFHNIVRKRQNIIENCLLYQEPERSNLKDKRQLDEAYIAS